MPAPRKPRGHWTKGKPRHTPIPRARLARVRSFFERHRTTGGGIDGANTRSIRRVATAVGVSDRTLRKWLAGERNPDPVQWRDLVAYLESHGF